MSHKYLPRLPRGVLPAIAIAACGDPAGPADDATPVALDVSVAADAPVAQRGFEVVVTLRDGVPIRGARVVADSGTADQRVFRWVYEGHTWAPTARVVVFAPGGGRRRFTVVVSDTAGRTAGTSFERTFEFADLAYAAAPLPDLGAGGNARALNARGDAAGWVLDARGRQRPAVWRAGVLEVLSAGASDTAGAVATRINAAGDVLLQLALPSADGTAVRVRRSDGALLTVGPLKYRQPPQAVTFDACCRVAADLSDDRKALGASAAYVLGARTAVLDVQTGAVVDSVDGHLGVLANGAQSAGYTVGGYANAGRSLWTRGFPSPGLPAGTPASICDRPGRYSTTVPVDIDGDANLLVSYCGSPAYLPRAGAPAWVDRYVGPGTAHLSRDGGVVASLDSTGAIWVWRVGTAAAARLRVAGDPWRFDSLGAVNASGQIAAQGVDRASGRRAALLLTPAPR